MPTSWDQVSLNDLDNIVKVTARHKCTWKEAWVDSVSHATALINIVVSAKSRYQPFFYWLFNNGFVLIPKDVTHCVCRVWNYINVACQFHMYNAFSSSISDKKHSPMRNQIELEWRLFPYTQCWGWIPACNTSYRLKPPMGTQQAGLAM